MRRQASGGIGTYIRNLKRAVQNGERRGVTTETLAALAPVLKTTAAWLLEGVGDGGSSTAVRVVGRIGAGAEILPEFEQIPPEGLFEIELPFPLPPAQPAPSQTTGAAPSIPAPAQQRANGQ